MPVGPGEMGEVSGGVVRGDTDVRVEVTVQTAEWTHTQILWIWIDGDVTIHITSASSNRIGYWEEYERWD
ncbi:MAG: hypothetical protein KAR36_02870 [Candidatus Latescibacteria bacterium]|nr:hypothetical protein [Candidatus Latescibacterota bacterium]